ncbi:MAG: DUF72 domain-containing protein [Luteimonas sp.]
MAGTRTTADTARGEVRVGIGGWTFAPWRDNFYPKGLVQRRELEYASRHVSAIEVNGTWYGAQKPATYAKWRDEAPDGFVFSAKAPQRITRSRVLAKTGAQVEDFLEGIATLGPKLGPIVWQFEQGRRPERGDLAAFVASLPASAGGVALRHVLDVRDAGCVDAGYVAMARQHGCATVYTDSPEHPSFADLAAPFVYARLMRSRSDEPEGYPEPELRQWAGRIDAWSRGGAPADLPYVDAGAAASPPAAARDVFVFFIAAAKERNPAAAMALLRVLGENA